MIYFHHDSADTLRSNTESQHRLQKISQLLLQKNRSPIPVVNKLLSLSHKMHEKKPFLLQNPCMEYIHFRESDMYL